MKKEPKCFWPKNPCLMILVFKTEIRKFQFYLSNQNSFHRAINIFIAKAFPDFFFLGGEVFLYFELKISTVFPLKNVYLTICFFCLKQEHIISAKKAIYILIAIGFFGLLF